MVRKIILGLYRKNDMYISLELAIQLLPFLLPICGAIIYRVTRRLKKPRVFQEVRFR